MMRQHSNRKMEGEKGWRVLGDTLWEEDWWWGWVEWGWNKVKDGFVYQKCPLSVMKRIEKAKKEKKRERKNEKVKDWLTVNHRATELTLLYVKTDTAHHLSPVFETNAHTSNSNNTSKWLMVERWMSVVSWVNDDTTSPYITLCLSSFSRIPNRVRIETTKTTVCMCVCLCWRKRRVGVQGNNVNLPENLILVKMKLRASVA